MRTAQILPKYDNILHFVKVKDSTMNELFTGEVQEFDHFSASFAMEFFLKGASIHHDYW